MKSFYQMKNLSLFEGNRAKVMSIFYDIIHNLCISSDSQYGILYPAVKYIENNYSTPDLANSVLAEQCEISEVYFRKLFVERYGVSPHQFVINIRINKAKQLLSEGVWKINAVSEKCGFSNPYHFSRLFKEKTGITPTEYMKKHRMIKI
jgi:AraC-like DNA-binding protein